MGVSCMRKFLAGVGVAGALLVASPAVAQYTGNTTTSTGAPTNQTQNEGAIPPGGSVTFTDCNFQPGTNVGRSFNSQNVNGKTVDSNGCVATTVQDGGPPPGAGNAAPAALLAAVRAPQLLAQQTTGSARRVLIDGQQVTGRVGTNTLVIQGTGANGASRTVTHVFELSGAPVGSDTTRAGDTARSGSTSRSALARTGVVIGGLSLVAFVLLAVGVVLLRGGRRRAAA